MVVPYWNVTVVLAPLLLTVPLSVAPVVVMEVAGFVVAAGPAAAPIVKFVSEISKKMLVLHATLTRAVVVFELGMVTACVPSLGVAATSVVGKVWPPSVESRISTLAQFTPPAFVLATFQVTVWELPPGHVTLVLGEVTVKGPAALVTLKESGA